MKKKPTLTWQEAAMLRNGVSDGGNQILICNATTGHHLKAIAFCDNADTAKLIAKAINHLMEVAEVQP